MLPGMCGQYLSVILKAWFLWQSISIVTCTVNVAFLINFRGLKVLGIVLQVYTSEQELVPESMYSLAFIPAKIAIWAVCSASEYKISRFDFKTLVGFNKLYG